jgi:hypothetical protein
LLTGHFGDWLYLGSAFWAADLLRERRLRPLLGIVRDGQGALDWRRDLFENGLRQLRPAWLQQFYRRLSPRPVRWPNPGLPQGLAERSGLADYARTELPNNGHTAPDRLRRYRSLTEAVLAQARACVPGLYNPHGLERVDPFFDRRLVEFVFSLPADQLGRPGQSRFLLRKALEGRLPEALRTRQGKTDFKPLFERGLQDKERQSVADLMADPDIVRRGFVKRSWLQETLDSDWGEDGYFVWLYISLELWLKQYWPGGKSIANSWRRRRPSKAPAVNVKPAVPEVKLASTTVSQQVEATRG